MSVNEVIDGNGVVIKSTIVVDPPEQVNARDAQAKALAVLDNLEQADASWATLTAGQKDLALRACVRATAKLIRLATEKLDAS